MATTNGQPNPAASPISIHGQYVKDFSFENPNPLAVFGGENADKQPQISVDIQVNAEPVADKAFEIVLHVRADAKRDEQQLFLTEISYAGLVSIGDVPEEHVGPLLMIHCPTLFFPFVRQLIAEATRNGGYPPLMLEPVDFSHLYENKQKTSN